MPAAVLVLVPAVVIACMYLLLLYANAQFRNGMVQLFSNLPGWLAAVLTAIVNGAANVLAWAFAWAKIAVDPLVQLVWVPVHAILSWAGQVVGSLENIASLVATLPAKIGDVTAWATATFRTIIAHLATVALQVAAVAASVPGIAHAVAAALVATAVANLTAAIAAARAAAAAAVSALALTLARDVGSLSARITALGASLSAVIAADVTRLEGVIATDVRGLQGELGQLHSLVDPLVAAGLLVAVPAIEAEIETLNRECIQPTCSVITPQLPWLNAFADLATLGVVGALVGEAITHPTEAAAEVAGLVGGVQGAAAELVGAFAGVQL